MSATIARHVVHHVLDRRVAPPQLETVELLTTELMADAVVRAQRVCDLQVTWPREGVLHIEVRHAGGDTPEARAPARDEESDGGLAVVDALAAAWGVVPDPAQGRAVWFEVRV